jgi:5'(3')-deoxyribonucleotidase
MKKRLMIDMDEVICNGGFLYLVNKFTHKNYTLDDFEKYHMQDIIPIKNKKEWFKFFAENNMYEKAKFIGNAHEIIQKLNEKYEILVLTLYIITDNISLSGKVLKDKFDWLQKNLPFIPPYNYIFADNKELIHCDIKIDDKLNNLTGNTKTKLLFTAYHNKKLSNEELTNSNIKRVNSWEEIEKILL